MTAPAPDEIQIKAIDQFLPQTQCGKCDYPRCLDYARAIATGEAEINQCPPGGEFTINALSQMLERKFKPLNPDNGYHQPLHLALIEENACIGCKLCIKACPVDCIVGAVKLMHTVITNECTGCELCLPACPTDCIIMHEPTPDHGLPGDASMWPAFSRQQVDKARQRTELKLRRLARLDLEREKQRRDRRRNSLKSDILAAVERKQNR